MIMKLIVNGDREYMLHSAYMTIGRSKNRDIVLDDPRVSRRHAILQLVETTYAITDVGSTNGTYVNGFLIGSPRLLYPGDEIQIGEATLIFVSEGMAVGSVDSLQLSVLDTAPTRVAHTTQTQHTAGPPPRELASGRGAALENDTIAESTSISPRLMSILREMATGTRPSTIHNRLVKRGLSEKDADLLLGYAEKSLDDYRKTPAGREVMAQHALRGMLLGGIQFTMTLVTTALFYVIFTPSWWYVLLWGAVGVGGVYFMAGFVNWLKYRK